MIDAYNEEYSPLFGGKIEKLKQSDVTKDRRAKQKRENEKTEKLIASLDPSEREILALLSEPRQADDLCEELTLPFPEIVTALQSLEMQGLVRNTPEGYVAG